jgi:hypothetical protein
LTLKKEIGVHTQIFTFEDKKKDCNDAQKYSGYRVNAEEKGRSYLYLTRGESYNPYRAAMQATFGEDRAFFLDTPGDWERFVSEVLKNC